jgi:hypothetical protein
VDTSYGRRVALRGLGYRGLREAVVGVAPSGKTDPGLQGATGGGRRSRALREDTRTATHGSEREERHKDSHAREIHSSHPLTKQPVRKLGVDDVDHLRRSIKGGSAPLISLGGHAPLPSAELGVLDERLDLGVDGLGVLADRHVKLDHRLHGVQDGVAGAVGDGVDIRHDELAGKLVALAVLDHGAHVPELFDGFFDVSGETEAVHRPGGGNILSHVAGQLARRLGDGRGCRRAGGGAEAVHDPGTRGADGCLKGCRGVRREPDGRGVRREPDDGRGVRREPDGRGRLPDHEVLEELVVVEGDVLVRPGGV